MFATNEVLEKELTELQNKKDSSLQTSNTDHTELEDEIRRLQAQNTALQKNLAGLFLDKIDLLINCLVSVK